MSVPNYMYCRKCQKFTRHALVGVLQKAKCLECPEGKTFVERFREAEGMVGDAPGSDFMEGYKGLDEARNSLVDEEMKLPPSPNFPFLLTSSMETSSGQKPAPSHRDMPKV